MKVHGMRSVVAAKSEATPRGSGGGTRPDARRAQSSPNWRRPVFGNRIPAFWLLVLLLLGVLGVLLGGVLVPGQTLFSNDGPLGRLMAQCHRLPERFTGCWEDLNSIGYREAAAAPNISLGLQWLLKPLLFSKLYAPLALFFLGLCAWRFFRKLNLAPAAAGLGALAMILNSNFFSTACWGVASQDLAAAMVLLAMAELVGADNSLRGWLRVALAGLAVGMAVLEGADVGALWSMLVAAFILWRGVVAWKEKRTLNLEPRTLNLDQKTAKAEPSPPARLLGSEFEVQSSRFKVRGSSLQSLLIPLGQLVLVATCAALLAAQALSELTATNIEGMAVTNQAAATSQQRWDWATQWSLPKRETLGLVSPGLFGYRVDTLKGGAYWGDIGRDPAWESYLQNYRQGPEPAGMRRFVGGGFYAGVVVVLVACWAAAHSLRPKDSVFALSQRRFLRFWLGTGLIALLLAFGRFAPPWLPLYRALYALPYFSTVRNPVKFLHFVSLAIVVLFAFGVDGLWRKYVGRQAPVPIEANRKGKRPGLVLTDRFDWRWFRACCVIFGLAMLGWAIYASSRTALITYLKDAGYTGALPVELADFSIRQVGWFALFFALALCFVGFLFKGAFKENGATAGAVLLGGLLIADLARADSPWVVYWNYGQKYASNAVVDVLRDKPWEHRVALAPVDPSRELPVLYQLWQRFRRIESIEWAQHLFPYYNIESLNIVQLSRWPDDLLAYDRNFKTAQNGYESRLLLRQWQLCNVRYLLGTPEAASFLNEQVDPLHHRFRVVQRFELEERDPGFSDTLRFNVGVVPGERGRLALLEFAGALPRARLYSNWQIGTNDQAALGVLTNLDFDIEHTVLVQDRPAVPPELSTVRSPQSAVHSPQSTGAGTVEFVRYRPREVLLKATASAPSVLLLNDRFDPHWQVLVDGSPQPLLRCNYIMRGVFLQPGAHQIEFRFRPPSGPLQVSLAGLGLGVLLLGVMGLTGWRKP